MLTKLKIWFRDWRRGYTDQDAFNMFDKFADKAYPGKSIPLSDAEHKAFMDYQRANRKRKPFT